MLQEVIFRKQNAIDATIRWESCWPDSIYKPVDKHFNKFDYAIASQIFQSEIHKENKQPTCGSEEHQASSTDKKHGRLLNCTQSPIQNSNSLEVPTRHDNTTDDLCNFLKIQDTLSVASREVSGLLTDLFFLPKQSRLVRLGSVRSRTDTDRNMNMFIFKLKKSKFKEQKKTNHNGVGCDL